jgi:hypothetical protein
VRIDSADQACTCDSGRAAWLTTSSKTTRYATLRRDGAVEWDCHWCGREWLIFLLAHRCDGTPAFADPGAGASVRPMWRPR